MGGETPMIGGLGTADEATAQFGAITAILMVLVLAFLTMGAMDYYATEKTDEEIEFARTMKNTKQGLIGGRNGIEDSLPEHTPPEPDRVSMVAGLSSEGAGTGERIRRRELNADDEENQGEQGLKKKKKKKDNDRDDKFDKA